MLLVMMELCFEIYKKKISEADWIGFDGGYNLFIGDVNYWESFTHQIELVINNINLVWEPETWIIET